MKSSEMRQVIIDDLLNHPKSTRQEIALRTGLSYPRVCRWLKKMSRDVVRHGGWPRMLSARRVK